MAVDFVNAPSASGQLSWESLIRFLEDVRIIVPERAAQLLRLPQSDLLAAERLLLKARKLRSALRKVFGAILRKQGIAAEWVEPVNEVLRITEGHDELVQGASNWQIAFVAREAGLDWLLAAIARSGAEIIAEGSQARLRACANPQCGLVFYDTSRTHLRRWCSMAACGNRSKVAAFARRHSAGRNSAA